MEARAVIEEARRAGLSEIRASVDAPNVASMFSRSAVLAMQSVPSFSAAAWNQYYVQVTNEDLTTSPASLTEAITLTPPGWTH